MLGGVLVPVVTPFAGGEVDDGAFAHHVRWLLEGGVGGLVVGGIAGEGPTLTRAEFARLVRRAADLARGWVPVIAATGTCCTATTIRATHDAKTNGAAAALVVTPYYNRPTQEGICRHFEAVAAACDLPLILHNAPSRTNVALAPASLARLQRLPSLFALLDEAWDRDDLRASAEICSERLWRIAPRCGEALLPGLRRPRAAMWGAANIAPRLCGRIWARQAKFGQAKLGAAPGGANGCAGAGEGAARLAALQQALDREPEPAGIKYALSRMRPGFCPTPRLPLTVPGEPSAAAIRAALDDLVALEEDAPLPML